MKIAIMGSGGVGGYFGGRLAASGVDVTFVARGDHLAAIQRDGLRIESRDLPSAVVKPAKATDDPASVGEVDYVIIGVKLWATAEAGRAMRPMVGPDTTVISLQNGVDCNDILADIVGRDHLIGGVAFISSSIERPGVISHIGTLQRVVMGEFGGGTSPRLDRLHTALQSAGIDVEISSDIQRTIWEKFVLLVGLSSTTTLMRTTVGPIREDSDGRAFLHELMREAVAVGRARGVALPTDYADDRLKFADGLPYDMTSSMHHDFERGNRLEVGWLSGTVARFGRALGMPVPVNQAVYAILKARSGPAKSPG